MERRALPTLPTLPPAVEQVTVPTFFSPSALGASSECRLRLVAASAPAGEGPEKLISGPEAAVGILFHRVLERASKFAGASLDEVFDQEYERTVDEIRRDPRRTHFAALASTRSLAEWRRMKTWVVARASRTVGASRSEGTFPSESGKAQGAEVPLQSFKLRLRGKADRVRQLGPNRIEIRDFKTGAVLDEQGEVKEAIALQLRAYGLIILENRRDADIRLIVDDGDEREVVFDDEARRDTKVTLEKMVGAMPPPGRARAIDLARTGRSCWGCTIRYVCPAYRIAAPDWWKKYPSEVDRISNDVWGVALEVLGEGRVAVVLRDDAGRRVRIGGLDSRHGITQYTTGQRLWFFGLEATGPTRGFDGSRFHPRSFHEIPRDHLERRAWALQVFGETGDFEV